MDALLLETFFLLGYFVMAEYLYIPKPRFILLIPHLCLSTLFITLERYYCLYRERSIWHIYMWKCVVPKDKKIKRVNVLKHNPTLHRNFMYVNDVSFYHFITLKGKIVSKCL